MKKRITYVGMDVHTRSAITVARLIGDAPRVEEWTVPFERRALERLARRLVREAGGGAVCCAYEAGPPGFTVKRWMEGAAWGLRCELVAPSRMRRSADDRVKNDRRDARRLAQELRNGALTFVYPPTEADESTRGLVRVRDGARRDRQASQHRVRTFLLVRGCVWSRRAWTQEHRQWLRTVTLPTGLDRQLLDELLADLDHHEQKLARLDAEIAVVAEQPAYRERVGRLRCLRGVDTLTALALTATLHTPERFPRARSVMRYVGLGVSENSTGGRTRRGGLLKDGDPLARRLLIEFAKNQRTRPHLSQALKARRKGQPTAVVAYADRAMRRLHQRYARLVQRGAKRNVATAAVAREGAGFIWALLQPTDQLPLLLAGRG
jgi:transposase